MKLNKAQQLAVETIEGPVMVIAGPGTGKTQIIAERIANILKTTDTDPSSILALTFTESGAKAMRERLITTIGEAAYYVNIATFHSFCSSVIQEFPDRFALTATEPLAELERVEIFHEIIDAHQLEYLKPVNLPHYYTGALIKAIQELKREGVTPEKLTRILKGGSAKTKNDQYQLGKNRELLQIYTLYQKALINRGRYDFEDMINFVVEAFSRDENLLRTYQERLQYFLIDEYQDTNSSQNRVIDLLASFWGQAANMFVVGDPNQCLPAGTKITTKNGLKNIETLLPGEEILTAVGKGYTSFTKIKRIFKQRKKVKFINLLTRSGKKITVTDNHKMFCFLPPREVSRYWYVYLMYKKTLGWRMGITKSLSIRLKVEVGADKIVGIKACSSESEARYWELVLSLKYRIPTVVFKDRGNSLTGEWLQKLYREFDTEKNAQKLAQELGINLDQPHYVCDATTFGDGRIKINLMMCSRNYRCKYDKAGLLKHPTVLHELQIETSNKSVINKLQKLGFKLRNKNIGKGLRLNSVDFPKLLKIAKQLEKEIGGFIDIKASLGTLGIQHRSSRVMQAGNLLIGNYLPVIKDFEIVYDEIIKREEKICTATIYDLEVPPSHNFIANGIVVHNSIYRFQGASLENSIGFTKTYPKAKVITLEQNYRSHQLILDASFDLIQKNRLKIEDIVSTAKAKLKAQAGLKINKLQIIKLPAETVEAYWVAQKVKELIEKGTKPEAICVLYRHNYDSGAFGQMLVKLGVPVEIEGGGNVLTDPVINQLITLMKAIGLTRQNLEDLDLFTLMHYSWFKLEPLAVLKLARQASQTKQSMVDLILAGKAESVFTDFLNQLAYWQQQDSQLTFSQWFEKLIKQSGFLDWVISRPDSVSLLNRINSLFAEIKRLNNADHQLNLAKFLQALDLMAANRLTISEQDLDIKSQAVSLSTVHKAKGKEWEHVFIVKAVDNKWGNNAVRDLIKLPAGILTNTDLAKKEKNEDERRLFYVALTRAKKQVYLSYSERYLTGNYLKEVVPSMFLTEIPKKFQEAVEPKLAGQAQKVLQQFLDPPKQPVPTIEEKDWFKALVGNFRLSATALNTYLTCAYKFKLNVLVRVPRAKADYFAFGSAVHKALEMFHKSFIKEDKHPGKEYLLAQFELALKKEALIPAAFQDRIKQGRMILTAYYDCYHDEFRQPLFVERFFGYGWSRAFLDDIPLTGKMDRIDLIDKTDKTVRVVDYKTGQAKTRNQILGKTKEANLDYFRQLVFYKLLASLDKSFPLKVRETMLDFVEPNKKTGKFRQEKFLITDEQVNELKEVIRSVMKEIRSLNFERTTDYRKCLDCEYLHHCWPEGIPQPKMEQLKLPKVS